MSGKKKKSSKELKIKYECNSMSIEQLTEIQAEAYYRALKRIAQEKEECVEGQVPEKKNNKRYSKWLFILRIMLCPWKAYDRLGNQVYDGILTIVVSAVLQIIGTVMWTCGIILPIVVIYGNIIDGIFSAVLVLVFVVVLLMFGAIFILSGDAFSKETDSNKIYAYSASIIALISCVLSIITLWKT